MRFAAEPAFAHDRIARVGVLLANLGTPNAPTPSAVRKFLARFLSDPRVIEIPAPVWQPVLHGLILRTRPASSARKYAAIWTKDGSPLAVHSGKQKSLLQGFLGQRLKTAGFAADLCPVALGMRYSEPSIERALDQLRAAHCEKILVVPLYPQYAASTTGATFDAMAGYLARTRRVPAIRFVDSFHDDAGYIKALAKTVNDYWMKHGRPDKLVLSFHGLPRRSLTLGDPYHCFCHTTARLLAREIGLEGKQWMLTFQSRFGRALWLQPYTAETLTALAKEGLGRVDVFCPGFVADCLETLEEIGILGRQTFLRAGGREFHLIPCLNEQPMWIAALADLVFRNLGGWIAAVPSVETREQTQQRAKALGAAQ